MLTSNVSFKLIHHSKKLSRIKYIFNKNSLIVKVYLVKSWAICILMVSIVFFGGIIFILGYLYSRHKRVELYCYLGNIKYTYGKISLQAEKYF